MVKAISDKFDLLLHNKAFAVSHLDFYGHDFGMDRLGFLLIPYILRRKIGTLKNSRLKFANGPFPLRKDGGYGWFIVEETIDENESCAEYDAGCNVAGDDSGNNDGFGYLFTAKSGTGKSTHARLCREIFGDGAVMVNDDKPLLRITKDGVIAYGTPWDGKHRLSTNTSVPLKGICILERATENHIIRLDTKEQIRSAYPMIVQQTHKSGNPANALKTMELIDRLHIF